MTLPKVQAVGPEDSERAISALTLAFATDPCIRRFYPDPRDHLAHFPEMMRIQIAQPIKNRSAHYVEGFSAAAIWFPPAGPNTDVEAEQAARKRMDALIEDTAHKDGNDAVFAAVEKVAELHPKERHWYLFAIGVDPRHQNEGLGSMLMKHALPKVDADGALAYLESSSPRNVPFYERHGFEVVEVVQIGDSPRITLMAREPR